VGSLSLSRAACLLLALEACAVAPASAQQPGSQSQAYPGNYPPALPKRDTSAPPRLTFETVREIVLPGPLSGDSIEFLDGRIRVPLLQSVALVALEPGSEPVVSSAPRADAPDASEATSQWVVSPDGRFRYQTRAAGLLVAQKRCRHCAAGWKRAWSLRVPGATRSPPTLQGRRLYFASSDGRVYCVRNDNGHRVWAVDVGDRVSGRIAVWNGLVPETKGPWAGSVRPLDLVLVLTDSGGALYALDPYDGGRVGILELPPEKGRLAAGVTAAPDGTIIVGRTDYASTDGTLVLLRLVPAPDAPDAPAAGSEPANRPVLE